MKFDNQLRYAVTMIGEYDGSMPLSHWLNNFFREHKQMGSRDRKTLSEMVYGYYRFGHMKFENIEARILSALASMNAAPEMVEYFGIPEKKASLQGLFPWKNLLSDGIVYEDYVQSFLVQPDVFLRIRPGNEKPVFQKLEAANIPYQRFGKDCVAVSNRTKITDILEIDREVVVQDKSSQQTGELIRDLEADSVWDCCAGSGGKAIMAFDLLQKPELIVSDRRSSILQNLYQRFSKGGIDRYEFFVSDLAKDNSRVPEKQVDLIIADLPCTGSGTWARTPEQLYFFDEARLKYYTSLQEKILNTILAYNKDHSPVLYITCSVFKMENEAMVEYITRHSSLKAFKVETIAGYNGKADTMFAALLTL